MKRVISLSRYLVISLRTNDWILCAFCAILLILSFPKFNLWIPAWFGFVPLFFALENKSKFKAFLLSYLAGIIFWLGIIYWLIHVTFAGLILLILYLALYFGIFGLIISLTHLHTYTLTHLLFVPSVWVLLEYLRSHLFTGFGWALLGYSQYLNVPVIQIADITGAWGVSFLVMMANVFVYDVMRYASCAMRKKQKKSLSFISCLLPLLLLFLSFGYGFYKLLTAHSAQRTTLKISVIQGNIPQSIKWQEYAKEQIFQRYLSLTREALRHNPDLIIWPEAAFPEVLGQDTFLKERLEMFASQTRVPLLTGAVSVDRNTYYNSAILISKKGEITQQYDKLHLVPFGEYIPFKRMFGFLKTVVPIGDFIPGKEYTVFSLDARHKMQKAGRFSVLVCFEDIFPQISRQFVKKGADFLVNITNDAWFGDTSSPYQHLSASVFRAVENGVYLVRAANTGISGFVTPHGKIYPLFESSTRRQTFTSGFKAQDIICQQRQDTFYTRWGNWFILICLVSVTYGIAKIKKQKKPSG